MRGHRHSFFTFLCTIAIYSCGTQAGKNSNITTNKFEKLVYHSSRCDGTCPQIDMQIDSTRTIIVNRAFFTSKGGTDSSTSGRFKGVLEHNKYDELLKVLQSSNYQDLNFPDILCCDGVITTIIIYSAGKRKYLKSMTPPPEASELISFLHDLGTDLQLAKTAEEFDPE